MFPSLGGHRYEFITLLLIRALRKFIFISYRTMKKSKNKIKTRVITHILVRLKPSTRGENLLHDWNLMLVTFTCRLQRAVGFLFFIFPFNTDTHILESRRNTVWETCRLTIDCLPLHFPVNVQTKCLFVCQDTDICSFSPQQCLRSGLCWSMTY